MVRADLSPLSGSAQAKQGTNGKVLSASSSIFPLACTNISALIKQTYWTIVFSVEIHFGLTEFKARIKWVDDVRAYQRPYAARITNLVDFNLQGRTK